ncbi:NAD(P)/FAD-dependent oxidoreductase [Deinococcus multiflagellatus]|uniref:NAD(P)/FAD-dependent oxidoreductase n=1 Tax=Deinococcus multiflagellatus TaxID=1656887 RepID=A0ABW1ZN99_9DEIO|nr:NAD(P)/FAD-dependent oxidoreductase [Deinococcus multiflagellatus]MBZ9714655.1 NAD(P)/FAD-dependent oxidoreductase [Deinococcus multiflagellatus]
MSAAALYDAVVVGAGPAGLNAALVLGGAGRRVLLLDGGPPRNVRAQAAHGVFTRDGATPVTLKTLGLGDLSPYAVTVRPELAREVAPDPDGFALRLEGRWVRARRVLFATGVRDVLPTVPGLRERWGATVHHCPYCDGWPNKDARLGVLGSGQEGHHLALSVRSWSERVTLLTDGPDELTDEQREDLRRVGIPVHTAPILRLGGRQDVRVRFRAPLADPPASEATSADSLSLDALFLNPTQQQRSTLPAALGCELNDKGRVVVNEHGMTSVRGVWAAGDMTGAPQYVMSAAASGMIAAVSLNTTLIHEEVRHMGAAFHKSPDEPKGEGEAS